MYAVIMNPEKQTLPTVINMNDKNYCDFIMSGYEPIETGTRREMNDKAAELLEQFVYELNYD